MTKTTIVIDNDTGSINVEREVVETFNKEDYKEYQTELGKAWLIANLIRDPLKELQGKSVKELQKMHLASFKEGTAVSG